MGERIEALIRETAEARAEHRKAFRRGEKGRSVDAAACAIREQALRECLAIVRGTPTRPYAYRLEDRHG